MRSFIDRLNPFGKQASPIPRRPRRPAQDATRGVYELSNGLSYNTHTGTIELGDLRKQRTSRAIAMQTTPVIRSITLISSTIADLIVNTLHIVDADGNRVENPSPRQKALLHKLRYAPNDMENPYEFAANMATEYLVTGNSLVAADMSGGVVMNLYRMISDSTHATFAPKKGEPRYKGPIYHWPTRAQQTYNIDRVCHIRYPNLLGTQRYDSKAGFVAGPVDLLVETLGIGARIDAHINNFFASNLKNLRMMFHTDAPMDDSTQQKFQEWLDEWERSGETIGFVHNGMKFTTVNPSVMDPSMTTLRKEQVHEVSRVWGVPVFLLAEEKSAVNIEISAREFWDKCGKAHTNSILSALSHRFLSGMGEARKFKFAIDERELLRGNTAALVSVINAMKGDAQNPGMITSAEGREMIGLPRVMEEDPNADIIRRQLRERQSQAAGMADGNADADPPMDGEN